MSMPPTIVDGGARDRAVLSDRSVLVQAPAGSGKTTLLAQRYLRLLARVATPEAILALTFTRRAAQEMRERVLDALHAARLPACPPLLNRQTWDLAVAARRRMLELQWNLEAQPSRLRIETIDAFNAWLAAQLPVTAGAGSGFRVLPDARPSYEEAARRALAHEGEDLFGRAVDRVLALDDQRWRRLVELIAEMLGSRDRWLPLLAGRLRAVDELDEAQLRTARLHFDEDLRLLIDRVLAKAQDIIGAERILALSSLAHRAVLRLNSGSLADAAWRLDGSALRPTALDAPRWLRLARILLTNNGGLRKRLTKTDGFPSDSADKAAMLDLIAECDRQPRIQDVLVELQTLPPPAYSDEQWARVRDVAQVLVLAAAQLEAVFREQGAVDFPAVSLAALRALGAADMPTDLTLRLDYRLQHILVDEFQDTSSAQLELVRLLTAGWQPGDGRSVFCVGDPMQSIYGFRQAEVRAFLELADEGIGDVRFDVQRLQTNFRSTAALVAWINACFARVMPVRDDRDRGAIAFRPSVAAQPGDAADPPAVELCGYTDRAAEADAVAAMIDVALHENPGWHIAVLVRAKTHATGIAGSLRARGIAFRAVDIEPLQDRSIVRDIIALTSALLHLGDRTAWLALLRAPWAGLPLADLLHLSRSHGLIWLALFDDAVLQRLSDAGRVRCLRIRTTLADALRTRTHGPLARWVESTWLCLGGAACTGSPEDLDLARTAFARLGELEERGLPDPSMLADSFADLFANHGVAGNVELMTIHKAKGLEFDMVVLPELDRHVPIGRGQLLLSHEFSRTGRDGMALAARPPVGAESDQLFDFLRMQLRDAATLEAERLLYVGCTRAKSRLRLTGMVEDDSVASDGKIRPYWPRAGSLLAVLWPIVGHSCRRIRTVAGSVAHDPGIGVPRGGALWRLPQDFAPRDSFPMGGDVAAVGSEGRDETPVFDWAGETARRIGSLVHAELQILDIERVDEESVRAREAHFKRWLALHGVPADRLGQAASRVVAALTAVLRDPRGRWILKRGYQDDLRECALSAPWHGELLHVVFDRSFVERGIRWVVDYKTSQHTGGGVEEFLDREVERYRPQLQRYARLAQKLGPQPIWVGLYFPLMGAWRAWQPGSAD